ncbi:hypothetical protein CHQ84_07675 [Francisella noatunensis subsp. orientalis]|uniref:Uncharacterized protein n=1 Tax=Francisella orientalis TaxID=299583 RepID=A0AAP7KIZ8_9GAMM|nr:hypothetical protein BMT43_04135 [Francisella orientalis]NIB61019.1 hypothetical protein [Francisella orientalis]NIB62537.1 hypothetical protein [Francisella orientalis]NIB66049.1 hypothetical protein [Francisella orientalis]NIY51170.1 hypothetical protein [Francisella orientalis]
MYEICPFITDRIWVIEYPVKYSGIKFSSITTLIKLNDNSILIHSPCKIDNSLKDKILKIGNVSCIIAPGNFHHLHVNQHKVLFLKLELISVKV